MLGLPFLEAMLPTGQAHAHGGGPLRFAGLFTPNGYSMSRFTPDQEGADYDLKEVLVALASVQSEVSVLTGLTAVSNGFGAHAQTTGSAFTGTPVATPNAPSLHNTTSIDQAYAELVAGETPLPSLVLGVAEVANPGDDAGYPDVYHRHISWDGATPMARLDDPTTAFELVFGNAPPGASDADLERRQTLRLSVLDSVLDEANSLNASLGPSDRRKVDEYLTSVRELEMRVAAEDVTTDNACAGIAPGPMANDEERVRAMLDIIALAFACDQTRAATFLMGRSFSSLDYRDLLFGGSGPWHHHQISHQLGSHRDRHDTICRWELTQVAYFIESLRDMDEGGSSVLDNTIVAITSDVSDGHSHDNMPVLLAGGGGGALTPGRHIRYSGGPPTANLWGSVFNALGGNVTSFGEAGNGLLGQL